MSFILVQVQALITPNTLPRTLSASFLAQGALQFLMSCTRWLPQAFCETRSHVDDQKLIREQSYAHHWLKRGLRPSANPPRTSLCKPEIQTPNPSLPTCQARRSFREPCAKLSPSGSLAEPSATSPVQVSQTQLVRGRRSKKMALKRIRIKPSYGQRLGKLKTGGRRSILERGKVA